MAKLLGEFLHHLAVTKAGMNPDDEKVKNFLLNGELMKIELPEEIEKGIDNQLISIKDAKNNHQEIKNYYQKQTLDGVDNAITSLLDEEADEELRTNISGIRSTYQKVPALVKAIKDREAKKAGATKPQKEEIQREIDRLHLELKTAKEDNEKVKSEADQNLQKVWQEYAFDKLIAPYKTIYDDLDPDIKRTSLKTIIDKELQDNKVKLKADEKRKASLEKEDGTSYYGENHQLITPESFIEKTLSRNKLLITTSKPQANGETSRPQPNTANGATNKNPTLSGLAREALNNFQTNQAAMGV